MKKVLWIIVIILVILFGWRVYQKITKGGTDNRQHGKGGKAVSVETGKVLHATMQDIGRFSGSLKARSAYTIAPRISGRLEKLTVHLGDKVVNGQIVAVIDDAIYQQDLEAAKADLAVVQAQVEQARLSLKAADGNWNNTKNLFKKGYESQAVMDQTDADHASSQAKYDVAQAQVQRAQSALRKAEIQLSYTQIKAIWTGGNKTRLVGEIFTDEGDLLTTSTPLMTLVDNSELTAEIDVIEKDYTRIRIGQPVIIQSDAFPGKLFTGKLARLAPVLQESSRQARAEIDIPNPESLLKPGMYIRAQIVYAEHKNAMVVPLGSLVERDNKTGVFVVDKTTMTARFLPLTIGIKDDTKAEVLEPAISGNIITIGQEQLQDGNKIKLPHPTGKKKGKQGDRQ